MEALSDELTRADLRMQTESSQSGVLEQELRAERIHSKTCQQNESEMRAELEKIIQSEKQAAAESKRHEEQLLKQLSEVQDKFNQMIQKLSLIHI